MKSILFLIACCATFCFAASDTISIQEVTQELACGKCKSGSCKGCGGYLACGDDIDCQCGCGKNSEELISGCGCKGKGKGNLEIARCGCKGKGKVVNLACSSCKKGKPRIVAPIDPINDFSEC